MAGVPYFDYRPGYLALKGEIDAAIQRVLASGQLILGPEVESLEREFAAYTACAHAVGVGSGTEALTLALLALGIGPGDEVITVANAGAPPVSAIRATRATPRFVDVMEGPLVLDPEQLRAALTPRTRCLLPVHLYGNAAPMDRILEFADRHGLPVVEDCAQGHGATYFKRHVGCFGRIGCFSFYPTKNLGAFGDGGMCVTSDPRLAERLRMLRQYGYRDDRHAHCDGVNSRLDELQAAILRVKLRHLDAAVTRRRELASIYLDGLRGSRFRLPEPVPGAQHAFHLFVIRADSRDDLAEELSRQGFGSAVHYPEPVHHMEAYRALGNDALSVTEEACRSVLSLPLYDGLEPEAARRIVRVLTGSA